MPHIKTSLDIDDMPKEITYDLHRPNPVSLSEPVCECPLGDNSIISNESENEFELIVGQVQSSTTGKSLVDTMPEQ
jgi:hypothetical protein